MYTYYIKEIGVEFPFIIEPKLSEIEKIYNEQISGTKGQMQRAMQEKLRSIFSTDLIDITFNIDVSFGRDKKAQKLNGRMYAKSVDIVKFRFNKGCMAEVKVHNSSNWTEQECKALVHTQIQGKMADFMKECGVLFRYKVMTAAEYEKDR